MLHGQEVVLRYICTVIYIEPDTPRNHVRLCLQTTARPSTICLYVYNARQAHPQTCTVVYIARHAPPPCAVMSIEPVTPLHHVQLCL